MNIIVHKTTFEEVVEASDYIYEKLKELCSNEIRQCHDKTVIFIDSAVYIDFRFGDGDKLTGLRPNYYYTEYDDYVADILEQNAAKVNGKRLNTIDQVIRIAVMYMNMMTKMDEYWREICGET